MGNTPSSPSKNIPGIRLLRQDNLKKTYSSRAVVNNIFNYIMQHIDIKDFYKMSSPEECSKYIMLMTNSLDKYFNKIEVRPEQNKGSISFKTITDLTKDRAAESQSLCLAIAYFYTRILQIYGALAITVIDNETINQIAAGKDNPLLIGGNLDLGNFKIFEPFIGHKTALGCYELKGTNNLCISIKKIGIVEEYHTADIYFKVNYEGLVKYPHITISTKSISNGKNAFNTIRVIFQNVSEGRKEIMSSADVQKYIKVQSFDFKMSHGRYMYRNYTPVKVLDELINIIVKPVHDSMKKMRVVYDTSRDLISIPSKVDTHLDIKNMFTKLQEHKIPYCVSRALQLIDTKTFHEDKEFVTNICNLKFIDTNLPILPEPDRSLDTVYGLKLLENLFYDNDGKTPLEMTEHSSNQYKLFMDQLSKIFGSSNNTNLKTITNKIDTDECKDKIGKKIPLSAEKVGKTVQVVEKLYIFQNEHSKKAIDIMRQLFIITEHGISIHPNVFKGGIIEINRISNEARLLLMRYYTQCENIYAQGFNNILS